MGIARFSKIGAFFYGSVLLKGIPTGLLIIFRSCDDTRKGFPYYLNGFKGWKRRWKNLPMFHSLPIMNFNRLRSTLQGRFDLRAFVVSIFQVILNFCLEKDKFLATYLGLWNRSNCPQSIVSLCDNYTVQMVSVLFKFQHFYKFEYRVATFPAKFFPLLSGLFIPRGTNIIEQYDINHLFDTNNVT